jgi:hypothetical protein
VNCCVRQRLPFICFRVPLPAGRSLENVQVNALETTDLTRLAKLLGMLGSIHPGERDAAGLAAHRFVHERGLTWPEILCPPDAPALRAACATWRDVVDACLCRPADLSPWEFEFLRGLPRFPHLSPKQSACLSRIADRVLRRRQHEPRC